MSERPSRVLKVKRKGHVLMHSHVERGSRVSEVKRGSRVLAQPPDERDSRFEAETRGWSFNDCSVAF